MIYTKGLLFIGYTNTPCDDRALRKLMSNPEKYVREYGGVVEPFSTGRIIHINKGVGVPQITDGRVVHYSDNINPIEYMNRMVLFRSSLPDDQGIVINLSE